MNIRMGFGCKSSVITPEKLHLYTEGSSFVPPKFLTTLRSDSEVFFFKETVSNRGFV